MRKVTEKVSKAFLEGKKLSVGNTHTDGQGFFLHGNLIAIKVSGNLLLKDAGWQTVTTKERLNGILSVFDLPQRIYQKKGQWFYGDGEAWQGTKLIEKGAL